MQRLLRLLCRPRHLRIPHFRLLRTLHPRRIMPFVQRVAWWSRQFKYGVIFTLVGVSSWLGVCYLVRKLEGPPPYAPGRYYRRRRNTGHPVPTRAVCALDRTPQPVPRPSPAGSEHIQRPRGPSTDSLDRCPPPAPPPSPSGSEQTPQPCGPSVHCRVVHIACGAIGMRLLHMWGPSRAFDPPPNRDPSPNRDPPRNIDRSAMSGACIVCYDAAPETLLLPCRHLVLCEACNDELRARAARRPILCPVCRMVVADKMKVFR